MDLRDNLPSKNGASLKYLQVNAGETALEWTAINSGITVGTTPITSGTNTRVLFQNGGVVQQSANLLFNGNGLSIGGYDASTSRSLYVVPVAQTFGIDVEQYVANGTAGRFVANNAGTTTALSLNAYGGTTNNALYATNGNITAQNGSITIGNHTNGAKLDVKAGGALSTDIVQRWRNSADSANLGKLTGDGALTIGTYTNPSTMLSINTNGTGAYIGGLKAVYAVGNASGTAYGVDALGRSTTAGGISYGVKAIADGGGATGINHAGNFLASGAGLTNYAGYFDAISATTNYALYVQRGDMVFGVSPTLNKIGFWNATPIVQPTTAIASATLASLGGTALTDTDTFDGYTLKQIVKALRNAGLLA